MDQRLNQQLDAAFEEQNKRIAAQFQLDDLRVISLEDDPVEEYDPVGWLSQYMVFPSFISPEEAGPASSSPDSSEEAGPASGKRVRDENAPARSHEPEVKSKRHESSAYTKHLDQERQSAKRSRERKAAYLSALDQRVRQLRIEKLALQVQMQSDVNPPAQTNSALVAEVQILKQTYAALEVQIGEQLALNAQLRQKGRMSMDQESSNPSCSPRNV